MSLAGCPVLSSAQSIPLAPPLQLFLCCKGQDVSSTISHDFLLRFQYLIKEHYAAYVLTRKYIYRPILKKSVYNHEKQLVCALRSCWMTIHSRF